MTEGQRRGNPSHVEPQAASGESRTQAATDENPTRRTFLLWLIRAGYGAFALAFALPALALRTLTRESQAVASGDVLVHASDERQGVPIESGSLEPGMAVQAFPQDKTNENENLIELVRLSEDTSSIVAYSAICTHLGCTVQPTLDDEGMIFCLCHGSYFDPAEDAAVVAGPAGRPLPSLPIQVNEDGTIVAAGDFSGEVGPG